MAGKLYDELGTTKRYAALVAYLWDERHNPQLARRAGVTVAELPGYGADLDEALRVGQPLLTKLRAAGELAPEPEPVRYQEPPTRRWWQELVPLRWGRPW